MAQVTVKSDDVDENLLAKVSYLTTDKTLYIRDSQLSF